MVITSARQHLGRLTQLFLSGSFAPHPEVDAEILRDVVPAHRIIARLEEEHMKHVYANGNLDAMLLHKSGYIFWPIEDNGRVNAEQLVEHYKRVISSLDKINSIEGIRLNKFYDSGVNGKREEFLAHQKSLSEAYGRAKILAVETLYSGYQHLLMKLAEQQTKERAEVKAASKP